MRSCTPHCGWATGSRSYAGGVSETRSCINLIIHLWPLVRMWGEILQKWWGFMRFLKRQIFELPHLHHYSIGGDELVVVAASVQPGNAPDRRLDLSLFHPVVMYLVCLHLCYEGITLVARDSLRSSLILYTLRLPWVSPTARKSDSGEILQVIIVLKGEGSVLTSESQRTLLMFLECNNICHSLRYYFPFKVPHNKTQTLHPRLSS